MEIERSIEQLNRLLRGEISAIETYEQALQRVKDAAALQTLRQIAEDHRSAAHILQQQVALSGGTPDRNSGAWGMWATTVEGTASILGETVAIKVLKEGEEHGLKEYQDVAGGDQVTHSFRNIINTDFMIRQRQHIGMLDRLMDSLS